MSGRPPLRRNMHKQLVDSGYFIKRVMRKPDWLQVPGVLEVCSVSNCISMPPEGWVERWLHNQFGWSRSIRDRPAGARRLLHRRSSRGADGRGRVTRAVDISVIPEGTTSHDPTHSIGRDVGSFLANQ
jgi:hypothetical protein